MDPLTAPIEGADHREVGGAEIDIARVGNGRVKRVVYPPGFRWSTHMRPNVETELCMHAHVGFLARGHIAGEYADGCTFDYVAPQIVTIVPGHDAWVVGDEAAVLIQFDSEEGTARRFGLSEEEAHSLAMFDSLPQYVSGSPWTYAFLFAVAALDVIIPFVPSETSVILAGVLASTGDLMLSLVILSAAAGAILGDNTAYWIGRKAGHRIVGRWFKGERRKRIDWAEEQIQERGGYLILIGRFIPGGRTVVTLTCRMLRMAWHRFI